MYECLVACASGSVGRRKGKSSVTKRPHANIVIIVVSILCGVFYFLKGAPIYRCNKEQAHMVGLILSTYSFTTHSAFDFPQIGLPI
jgi:hypothetical protein